MADIVVPADTLRTLTTSIFQGAGLPSRDAAQVAKVLVWADLRGVESHGITRVPRYLEMIQQGAFNPVPAMSVVKESGAVLVLDADRAAGPVGMDYGSSLAMQKAAEHGVGFVLIRRTTHTGALGFYVEAAAAKGYACVAGTASIPNMPYHGTRVASVATSAFCIGVPSGGPAPLVLDMATSAVSLGRLALLKRSGRPLQPGWAMNGAGEETLDPAAAALPLPLGGAKGAGLSLMIECLASLLAQNPIIAPILRGGSPLHRQNSFMLALEVARICPVEIFCQSVRELAQALKSAPRAPGVDEILMPSERAQRSLEARTAAGIPISGATWSAFGQAAASVGVNIPQVG